MNADPPLMHKPDLPTDDELDRAQEALDQIWPEIVRLVQAGHGSLTVYFQDGAAVKWDAATVKRHRRRDIDSEAA
jgi:1,2-phenylacetyl-CoA epoxidase catalytic subunit